MTIEVCIHKPPVFVGTDPTSSERDQYNVALSIALKKRFPAASVTIGHGFENSIRVDGQFVTIFNSDETTMAIREIFNEMAADFRASIMDDQTKARKAVDKWLRTLNEMTDCGGGINDFCLTMRKIAEAKNEAMDACFKAWPEGHNLILKHPDTGNRIYVIIDPETCTLFACEHKGDNLVEMVGG